MPAESWAGEMMKGCREQTGDNPKTAFKGPGKMGAMFETNIERNFFQGLSSEHLRVGVHEPQFDEPLVHTYAEVLLKMAIQRPDGDRKSFGEPMPTVRTGA